MGCGASAPMEEKTSPLDVDRTPSARLRVERSLSASVRGETAVTLEGYAFQGTLGYGAFARVLLLRKDELAFSPRMSASVAFLPRGPRPGS